MSHFLSSGYFSSIFSLFKPQLPQLPPLLTNSSVACGTLQRQNSTNANNSYRVLFPSEDEYPYPLDTCQTAFLVEKKNSEYEVTILFTRDTCPEWIDATSNLIMQRILLTESQIPVLNNRQEWAIIGTLDCQPDRNKYSTSFHQDRIPTIFLPNITVNDDDNQNEIQLRDYFFQFFQKMFPVESTTDVPVEPTTADSGILDYKSEIPIIAAAVRDRENVVHTVLPETTDSDRSFLFYLNNRITHSTPKKMDDQDKTHVVIKYNKIYDKSLKYLRAFRRFLEKYTLLDDDNKRKLIAHLKYTFYKYANVKLTETPPPTPAHYPPDNYSHDYNSQDYSNETNKKRKTKNNESTRRTKNKKTMKESDNYTYFVKRFSSDDIRILQSGINIHQPQLNNVDKLPFQFISRRNASSIGGDCNKLKTKKKFKKKKSQKKSKKQV